MATRAFTNITTAIAPSAILPVSLGEDGLILEFFRCQGGTAGDTTTIVPSDFTTSVRSVWGNLPATSDISTSGGTQVVLTHAAAAASTSVNFDVTLVCRRQGS